MVGVNTGVGGGEAGGATEVEISSIPKLEISSIPDINGKIELNSPPRYLSKEQFTIEVARELFQLKLSDTTNETMKNANWAVKSAMIFWNVIANKFGEQILVDGADTTKYAFVDRF